RKISLMNDCGGMIPMTQTDQILTLSAGPSQLISAICDEIGFEKIINEQLEWDKNRCHLSPGTRLKALVINILCDRQPLSHIHRYFRQQDMEMLFGGGVSAEDLNEYCIGRALDALHKATPWKVYSTLSISACQTLGLSLGTLHSDTTSFSLYGEYDSTDENTKTEDHLAITHGYCKQRRPDLKQIVLGMSVTPERIPILANIENGNTNDKGWNLTFIHKLRETLSKEEWNQLIYQADAALITTENLREIRGQLHFISRLPDTFKLSQELKEEAWNQGKWQEVGAVKPQKGATSYKLQSFLRELDGYTYRFVVVYSDKLNEQKEKTFQRQLTKEREQLEKAIRKFETTVYHCRTDAEEALDAFQKKYASSSFRYEITLQTEEQTEKRTKRGRPKKNEPTKTFQVFRPQLQSFEKDEEKVEEIRRKMSTFILITDLLDRNERPDEEILQTYKGQEAAETRFRLLKNPQFVDGFFLKKPSRIEALGIVFVMAILYLRDFRVPGTRKNETGKRAPHSSG
ncbi:IS1634 family transposase, partial [Bacillus sp. FJAT-47783]|uniref:IS1634 family transposase n=2 Tax=Bacillus sp. FJAT-47783 TaxID=2922712 RepID=UPI001FAE74DC